MSKRFKLRKLTLYIDPKSKEWTSETPWEDMNILSWDSFFLPHIQGESEALKPGVFLRPVNADLMYTRVKSEAKKGEFEQNITLTFEELGISSLQSQ